MRPGEGAIYAGQFTTWQQARPISPFYPDVPELLVDVGLSTRDLGLFVRRDKGLISWRSFPLQHWTPKALAACPCDSHPVVSRAQYQ